MKICNIKNINSVKNLVPACERCNKRKGHKMGAWIIRGFLGKHFLFWVVIWILRLIILIIFIYLVIQLNTNNFILNGFFDF